MKLLDKVKRMTTGNKVSLGITLLLFVLCAHGLISALVAGQTGVALLYAFLTGLNGHTLKTQLERP